MVVVVAAVADVIVLLHDAADALHPLAAGTILHARTIDETATVIGNEIETGTMTTAVAPVALLTETVIETGTGIGK